MISMLCSYRGLGSILKPHLDFFCVLDGKFPVSRKNLNACSEGAERVISQEDQLLSRLADLFDLLLELLLFSSFILNFVLDSCRGSVYALYIEQVRALTIGCNDETNRSCYSRPSGNETTDLSKR